MMMRFLCKTVGADPTLDGQGVQHALVHQGGDGAVDRRQVGTRRAVQGRVEDALMDIGDGQVTFDRFQSRQYCDP